jgi:hypothetical protein
MGKFRGQNSGESVRAFGVLFYLSCDAGLESNIPERPSFGDIKLPGRMGHKAFDALKKGDLEVILRGSGGFLETPFNVLQENWLRMNQT